MTDHYDSCLASAIERRAHKPRSCRAPLHDDDDDDDDDDDEVRYKVNILIFVCSIVIQNIYVRSTACHVIHLLDITANASRTSDANFKVSVL
jgi:hypothetical protein